MHVGRVWSIQVKLCFCPRSHGMGLVSASWYTFCLSGRGLVNKSWDPFCVLAGMGRVCSTQLEIHFVSSLLWAGFGQSKLRYMLCPRFYGQIVVNPSWDIFCVLTGMGWDWSTQIEMDFVPSLVWHWIGQQMSRWILRWCRSCLFNTCSDSFCILDGIGWFLLTHHLMLFVSLLEWEGFG